MLIELNNREIAALLWMFAFINWMTWKPNVRKSSVALFRAFFQRKIILSLAIAAIWICACIWILLQCGLWQWGNFKTTLVWVITFAFVTMLDINRVSEDNTYFRKTVRDTISATAAVAFVAESYSFSLPVELLFVPILVLVAGMKVMSEGKPELAQVNKLCYAILIIAGLTYFGYGAYQAVINFNEFASWFNFREFIVPILLSLLFLPFMYVFSAYVVYETIFVRLNCLVKDKALCRYAKYRAIFGFGLDLDLLRRWAREMTINHPLNRKEVKKMIAEVKSRKKKERYPPKVTHSEGWSPYVAKDYLMNIGLPTNDYHPTGDGQWFASSKQLELESDGVISDGLAYYIEGDEHAAKRLKIKLYVNNPSASNASESHFQGACEILLRAAVGNLPADLRERIKSGEVLNEVVGGRHILLKREDFNSGIHGGYMKKLTVAHELIGE